ncbi:MAG: CGGC domain-containing protein [Desulfobulbaceae bacterium]|jgi:predicted metal-binding protein|nr:CGGC domain-containing protein [Desulfobulbaceae bacterium]MDH3781527.1 CGGC domain-containing protein [Desulfobulbaceae bacterium]HKJ14237.1 CGGC domain-containing protein [Desulfobulbales bacterium]
MARIGILTCSNCTQDTNCASVVCLGDMRKRRGFFERYQNDEKLDLIGIINCAGCPTLAAPEKILKRVKALADYKLDALHLSYCMTALCPFLNKYQAVIAQAYPDLEIVSGTHIPKDKMQFRSDVKELLCPTVSVVQDMNDIIKGTLQKK